MGDLGLLFFRLSGVPVLDGAIKPRRQSRLELMVLSGTLEGMPPVLVTKTQ